jgi:hypothetical protein
VKIILLSMILLAALAVAVRGEVKEVFQRSETAAQGEPIARPLRILPPNPPDPPTPEELEAMRNMAQARAEFQAALKAVLARAGVTNMTDLASISNATAKLSSADVVRTNRVDQADSSKKLRVIVQEDQGE